MANSSSVLEVARQQGREATLPYAGAVLPREAHALLVADRAVQLVDVRTHAERDWVGRVDIAPEQHLAVQWTIYPGSVPNADFVNELSALARPDTVLLFLCRSGIRSRHAAKRATESGFLHCFDILEGFEGERDSAGHRKALAGWCHAGLPWIGA